MIGAILLFLVAGLLYAGFAVFHARQGDKRGAWLHAGVGIFVVGMCITMTIIHNL